jgi:hypothetical protein
MFTFSDGKMYSLPPMVTGSAICKDLFRKWVKRLNRTLFRNVEIFAPKFYNFSNLLQLVEKS